MQEQGAVGAQLLMYRLEQVGRFSHDPRDLPNFDPNPRPGKNLKLQTF